MPEGAFKPDTRHIFAGVLLLLPALGIGVDVGLEGEDRSSVKPAMGGGTFIFLNGVNSTLEPSMTATFPVSCGGVRGEVQVVRL